MAKIKKPSRTRRLVGFLDSAEPHKNLTLPEMADFLFEGDVTELTLRATKASFARASRILSDNLDYRKLIIPRVRSGKKATAWGIATQGNVQDENELAELLQRQGRMSGAYKKRQHITATIIREKQLLPEDRLDRLIA